MGFGKAFITSRFVAAGFLCILALGAPPVNAQGADDLWGREFFAPNAGTIYAMAVMTNGTIVYGGSVLNSDEGNARVVALSDSKRTRLATPISRSTVYAVALDGTNIYIGGDFKGFKENSAFATTNVAKWDGSLWQPLGSGLAGVVQALAVKEGVVFAGYNITNDTTTTGFVARWDGTNWTDLGADMHSHLRGIPAVQALQLIGDRLYVGGAFNSAGGVAATNIAEFSYGQWKPLVMGTNNGVTGAGSMSKVSALAATSNGELIVGGAFYNAGGVSASLVAKWTGSEWKALGLGLARPSLGEVDSLYCQENDIYAGGGFIYADGVFMPPDHRGFARWDGTKWGLVFSALSSEPTIAITGDGTNIYAATPLVSPVASGQGIIKVNSTNWSILGGGIGLVGGQNYGPMKAIMTNGTNIQVNGLPMSASTQTVVEWNSSLWVADGAGVVGSIESLAHSEGVTYTAGPITAIVGDGEAHGIAGLDGTNWFSVGAGLPSDGLVVVPHGANLFAGHQSGIRQWNGSAWTDIGNGLPGEVRAIAFDAETVFGGGAFATNSPEALTNVAQFSGETWKPLGLGVNGRVRALAVVDHKLYAGGDFTEADGKSANHIAVWDGESWAELGGGVSNGLYGATVNALQSDGVGGLFVAGDFQLAGDTTANFIAHWNGNGWEQLGSGLGGIATGLAIKGEDLFVVGQFQHAGDHPSSQIARWRMSGITLSALPVDNGIVSLEARGIIPKEFILQRSADLRSWQNISTNMLTPPRLSLNTSPDGTAVFYRVVVAN
jgi:hypothetical protein